MLLAAATAAMAALDLAAWVAVLVVVAHRLARPIHRRHILAEMRSAATPVAGVTIATDLPRGNNRLTSPRLDPLNVPLTFESAATFSDIARALSTPIYVTI